MFVLQETLVELIMPSLTHAALRARGRTIVCMRAEMHHVDVSCVPSHESIAVGETYLHFKNRFGCVSLMLRHENIAGGEVCLCSKKRNGDISLVLLHKSMAGEAKSPFAINRCFPV